MNEPGSEDSVTDYIGTESVLHNESIVTANKEYGDGDAEWKEILLAVCVLKKFIVHQIKCPP